MGADAPSPVKLRLREKAQRAPDPAKATEDNTIRSTMSSISDPSSTLLTVHNAHI